MALVSISSRKVLPIPGRAFPHRGILEQWQLEFPWVAGIVHTTPFPGPVDWKLWAGNVLTGRAVLLDSARIDSAGGLRSFPQFSLNHGRVAWTKDLQLAKGPVDSRIALYDLAKRKTSTFEPQRQEIFTQPTLYGDTVVWLSAYQVPPFGPLPYALLSYRVQSHVARTLLRNRSAKQPIPEPALWRDYLILNREQSPGAGGKIELLKINRSSGISVGRPLVLASSGGRNAVWGDRLVMWQTGIFDLTRSTAWTLGQGGAGTTNGLPEWELIAVGGRNVIAQQLGSRSYTVWQIKPCTSKY